MLSTAVVLGYFVVLEMTTGQSLGKMLLKLRVTGSAGNRPTLEEAIKRNLWLAVGIIPVVGWLVFLGAAGYLIYTINNSPTGHGWHDKFAGDTAVVKA